MINRYFISVGKSFETHLHIRSLEEMIIKAIINERLTNQKKKNLYFIFICFRSICICALLIFFFHFCYFFSAFWSNRKAYKWNNMKKCKIYMIKCLVSFKKINENRFEFENVVWMHCIYIFHLLLFKLKNIYSELKKSPSLNFCFFLIE